MTDEMYFQYYDILFVLYTLDLFSPRTFDRAYEVLDLK
jgi:hypothetical protein